ncbi:MAG TPA: TetR family transcriptional regulator [Solirubrobacteraceae bacterium]|jgi:AcrR family transcriptional regulator|nr:TetR family transcriptional regulator [Solirubrobacteraceae bacterium]
MPRLQVTEIQRGRMLAAAAEAVEQVGYARMTVAQVIARARVSRKTFYDVFTDREECFLATFDEVVSQTRSLAVVAYEGESDWREGTRAALARVLAFMDEEPGFAKLIIVEALAAGDRVLEHRAQLIGECAQAIDRGTASASGSHERSEVTAEAVVGGVVGVLHTRLLEDRPVPLSTLLGPLMSMIVLPYLGARVSNRELLRKAPPAPPRRARSHARKRSDPLEGLNMRLTYRTVRVLGAIAAAPGASNRDVAEGSGISDQGQISKLLTRLARLELVENVGAGQERGAANSWFLTPRGEQVERATRPR